MILALIFSQWPKLIIQLSDAIKKDYFLIIEANWIIALTTLIMKDIFGNTFAHWLTTKTGGQNLEGDGHSYDVVKEASYHLW